VIKERAPAKTNKEKENQFKAKNNLLKPRIPHIEKIDPSLQMK
jgi:hypothetical protein